MIDLKNKKILVVGDVILDSYTYGRKLGVSAETPTVVAEYDRTETFVGGAGLVARHLLRLGAEVELLTVGDERSVEYLMQQSADSPTEEELSRLQCRRRVADGWSFTEKRRFYVDDYKMVQYDVLNKGLYDGELCNRMHSVLRDLQRQVDLTVVCDNRHGVMAGLDLEMGGDRKVFIDSQVSQYGSNHLNYVGASVIFLNERELDALVPSRDLSLHDRLLNARDLLFGSVVILKRGALGSALATASELIETYPPVVKAVDTCGAGDAFLAAYAATEDLWFANQWAAISCTYSGTIVPKEIP